MPIPVLHHSSFNISIYIQNGYNLSNFIILMKIASIHNYLFQFFPLELSDEMDNLNILLH